MFVAMHIKVAMQESNSSGDHQQQKNEVLRLFAAGQLDPNVATARLLEVDRQRRQSEKPNRR
jgi:hypothetical protein